MTPYVFLGLILAIVLLGTWQQLRSLGVDPRVLSSRLRLDKRPAYTPGRRATSALEDESIERYS